MPSRSESCVKQAALVAFFVLCLVFARAGGVGVVDGPSPLQTASNEPLHASISLRYDAAWFRTCKDVVLSCKQASRVGFMFEIKGRCMSECLGRCGSAERPL